MKFLTSFVSKVLLASSALVSTSGCLPEGNPAGDFFSKAKPVWPAGLQFEKNLTAGFRADFQKPANNQAILKITGSSLYRILLNGEFIGHGPARAGHGLMNGTCLQA
jgi:hypothetical protein